MSRSYRRKFLLHIALFLAGFGLKVTGEKLSSYQLTGDSVRKVFLNGGSSFEGLC